MKNKALIVVAFILLVLAAVYFFMISPRLTTPTELLLPTPTEGDLPGVSTLPTQVVAPGNRVTIKWDQGSEELTFFNYSGYSFKSYVENGVTDKVVVINDGVEILQLGVNWVGYTEGSVPMSKPVKVKTIHLGDLYRETNEAIGAGRYFAASVVKLSGVCTGNGNDVKAPCAATDQLYGPAEVFSYLVTCNSPKYATKCDEVMKGLQIQ